jgi:uncharacterized protein (TIGR03067 family)
MHVHFANRLIGALLLVATVSPALAQQAKKTPAELHGHWKLVILGFEGREIKMRDNMPFWVIKGNQVLYGGDPLATLVVDPATIPPLLDLCYTDSKRVFEAVYAVEGDRLTICLNQRTQGVKERPLDFVTQGQPDRRLLIFERQNPGAGDGSQASPGYVGIQYGVKAKEKTVFVAEVQPNSPAAKAGLKKDDILLKIGGTAIATLRDAVDQIRNARPGTELTVRVRRGDMEQDFTLRVRVVPFFLLDD